MPVDCLFKPEVNKLSISKMYWDYFSLSYSPSITTFFIFHELDYQSSKITTKQSCQPTESFFTLLKCSKNHKITRQIQTSSLCLPDSWIRGNIHVQSILPFSLLSINWPWLKRFTEMDLFKVVLKVYIHIIFLSILTFS